MIPKTVTPARIKENLEGTQVKLDAEDMRRLKEVGSINFRFLKVHKSSRNVVTLYPIIGYSWIIECSIIMTCMVTLLAGESILASWAE